MTTEQFRNALQARPFVPFRVKTADGTVFHIRHPEMAAQSPGGRLAVVWTDNDAGAYLDLLLVTILEDEPSEKA